MTIISSPEPDVKTEAGCRKSQPAINSGEASITVLADYFSLANEIIQPDKYVSSSRYFCMRWEPDLGLVGSRIVRVLRALGYYDHKTGETRDGIPIDLPELARLCGFSVATVKREFGSAKDGSPANPHLHTFVQREKNYRKDAVTGQIWREENIYRVKMDDPVHPSDLPKLQALWEAKQKGDNKKNEKAREEEKARKAQSAPNGKSRKAQFAPNQSQVAPKVSQSAPEQSQDESFPVQTAPALIDSFDSSSSPKTTLSSPLEFSLALFGKKNAQEEDLAPPRPWTDLPSSERQPYLDQARAEIEAISEQSGTTLNLQLVESRGRSLYRLACQRMLK